MPFLSFGHLFKPYLIALTIHIVKDFVYLRILEQMSKVKSYVVLLDLEYDALVLDIFDHLLASIQDDHSPLLLAHICDVWLNVM